METPVSWKVLMVLGNQAPFRRLMIAMEAAGHEVVSITDQFQGVTLADEAQPDIILLDAEVPESWRTCSRIRDMANIPIILVGLEAPQYAWERAVGEGADAYLSVFTDPGEAIATAGAILIPTGRHSGRNQERGGWALPWLPLCQVLQGLPQFLFYRERCV